MRVLDLFSGSGGVAMGLHQAWPDAEITGVDIKPMPRYPFRFIQADAMTFPIDGYDFVWASPPCQGFSTMKVMPNAKHHEDLLTPTRERFAQLTCPWAIENVVGAPIERVAYPLFGGECGIRLCGSMFGLHNGTNELRRHRLFQISHYVEQPVCRHRRPVIGFYGDHARTRQRTVAGNRHRGGDITGTEQKLRLVRELMGIDWMEWHEANQAIPPAYSRYIAEQLIANTSTRFEG